MTTARNQSFDQDLRRSSRERNWPLSKRKSLAALAIFGSVGVGAFMQSDGTAAGVERTSSSFAESSAKSSIATAPRTAEQIAHVYAREDMRDAADYLQNEEVVQAVVGRVAEVIDGVDVVRTEDGGDKPVYAQTINNYRNAEDFELACTEGGEGDIPAVEVSSTLYRGGIGVLTMRLGSSACRSVDTPTEAVTLTVEVQHEGRETFDIHEAVYELYNDPSKAEVSSISVNRNNEKVFVTNSLPGTNLAGDEFYAADQSGEVVTPATHEEAAQIASKANQLALEVARTL